MKQRKPLTDREKRNAITMFRSGAFSVKEICENLRISRKELKDIIVEAGYGY